MPPGLVILAPATPRTNDLLADRLLRLAHSLRLVATSCTIVLVNAQVTMELIAPTATIIGVECARRNNHWGEVCQAQQQIASAVSPGFPA